MNDPNVSSDPLAPIYQQGSVRMQTSDNEEGNGVKKDLTLFIILAVVLLSAFVYLAWEKPAAEVPAPAAKEIGPGQ